MSEVIDALMGVESGEVSDWNRFTETFVKA